MSQLRQLLALLQMSLRGIPHRLGASIVMLIGTTCVVAVLVAMLSMNGGIQQLERQNARADRFIVMSKNAESTLFSSIDSNVARVIVDTPGIRRDVDGKLMATPVALVLAEAHRRADGALTTMSLLGVDDEYWRIYPELHLVGGRMFQPSLYELIVDKSRSEVYTGLNIGDKIHLRGVDWTIVGYFTGANSMGLIGNIDTVKTVFKPNGIQMVAGVLASPAGFDALSARLAADPTMQVDVKHELQMLRDEFKPLTGLMDFVSYFVGAVMGVGATLGAVNVMYAIIDGRRREIATLRAIGFGTVPLLLSVLVESVVFALPGAALGLAIAWLFFNNNAVNPFGISFHLAVTPSLALLGVLWALVMGLLGGISPAIRATRVPVAAALRGT